MVVQDLMKQHQRKLAHLVLDDGINVDIDVADDFSGAPLSFLRFLHGGTNCLALIVGPLFADRFFCIDCFL